MEKSESIFVDKEAINKLFREYGYYESIVEEAKGLPATPEDYNRRSLLSLFYLKRDKSVEYPLFNQRCLYLAELIDFFRSVRGKIIISGAVTNPRNGEVKGMSRKIEFNDDKLSFFLELFFNHLLDHESDGYYDYYFREGEKTSQGERTSLYMSGYNPCADDDDKTPIYLQTRFSEEGLAAILQYERKRNKNDGTMSYHARRGNLLKFLYNQLKEYGIVGTNNHPTQKEYCFLYDYLVIQGMVGDLGMYNFKGVIAKEKYQIIRNYISAYDRFRGSSKIG